MHEGTCPLVSRSSVTGWTSQFPGRDDFRQARGESPMNRSIVTGVRSSLGAVRILGVAAAVAAMILVGHGTARADSRSDDDCRNREEASDPQDVKWDPCNYFVEAATVIGEVIIPVDLGWL